MKFLGRTEEIKRIKSKLDTNNQENILIYGRRRIGKSFLIKKVLEDYNCIIINYQCKDINIENTLSDLTQLIIEQFNIKYNIVFNNFDEVLDFLFNRREKVIFVIDEYPYLTSKINGLNSILQNKIDKYKYDSDMKIIISGSQIDIMKDMQEYHNPLYGRFSEIINLKELNYYETSQFYPLYSLEDKVTLYSVFGGEPLYNNRVNNKISIIDNIIDLMVKENSFVEITINNILSSELTKITSANDVLLAIASGAKKNEEIVTKAHLDSSAKLNHTLKALLKLDLIEKRVPINDEKNKKKTLYYIKNNAYKFYYKYIYKNLSARNNMDCLTFFNIFIKEDFITKFIPNVFEDIAKQYLIIQNKANKINPPFYKIGTYWYDDKVNKTNGQFDIVTLDKNGYIFYEVKYINDKINESIINNEINQFNIINLNYYNLGFISKNGFDDTNDSFIFITLNDIYNI